MKHIVSCPYSHRSKLPSGPSLLTTHSTYINHSTSSVLWVPWTASLVFDPLFSSSLAFFLGSRFRWNGSCAAGVKESGRWEGVSSREEGGGGGEESEGWFNLCTIRGLLHENLQNGQMLMNVWCQWWPFCLANCQLTFSWQLFLICHTLCPRWRWRN